MSVRQVGKHQTCYQRESLDQPWTTRPGYNYLRRNSTYKYLCATLPLENYNKSKVRPTAPEDNVNLLPQ